MNQLKACLLGILLVCGAGPASAADGPAGPSKRITKLLAASDGASEQTAYRVRSVHEEYEIIAALGLTPQVQSLVVKKKPYDVIEAIDANGASRKIWFDISSFFPEF